MHKQYDAALNAMIDAHPDEWAACFTSIAEIPSGPATVLDTDLATTIQADKIFRIDGVTPSLLHLELVVNPRLGIPRDLQRYNVLADHAHDLPVETVLVLLRPKARASDQTGVYQRRGPADRLITEFHYRVEKVWERPVEFWLNAGISLAPLALLTDEANDDFEEALTNFRNSVEKQSPDNKTTHDLIFLSFILSGLRFDRDRIAKIYRRLNMLMQESTTYQGILEDGKKTGKTQGKREMIVLLGTIKFGPPSEMILSQLNSISMAEKLEIVGKKLLTVSSWDELFAGD